jgi:hypothetical protein
VSGAAEDDGEPAPGYIDGEGGLEIVWSREISLDDILEAAERRARYLAGEELPGQEGDDALASIPAVAGVPDGEIPGAGHGYRVGLGELAGHARIDPGPGLAGWLNCADPRDLDEAGLVTSITSWRKLASWAQARELSAIAELVDRRPEIPGGSAAQQEEITDLERSFAPSEVALALTMTEPAAQDWTWLAVRLRDRLPGTLDALEHGRIDIGKARLIDSWTQCLGDEHVALVEARVLERAPGQTLGKLRAALQRAVLAVDPAAAERRRERAERQARVEIFGEPEGTASLAGRNLPASKVARAWARICELADQLQVPGPDDGIDLARAQAYLALLTGEPPPARGAGKPRPGDDPAGGAGPASRDPAGRPGPGSGGDPESGAGPACRGDPAGGPTCATDGPDDTGRDARAGKDPHARKDPHAGPNARQSRADSEDPQPGTRNRNRASPVNLSLSLRTLLGLGAEPGQLSRIGPVTAVTARQIVSEAVGSGSAAWRVTVVGAGGEPLGVARLPRTHQPPIPAGRLRYRIELLFPASLLLKREHGPPDWGKLAGRGELGKIVMAAIRAAGRVLPEYPMADPCDHRLAVACYRIPKGLRRLLEARDRTCRFPSCRQPAWRSDMDHTVAHHLGGRTCGCNLSAECRHHHRLKQQPGWILRQPAPGLLTWTTPARLVYASTPEPYAA